ncbi:phosphoribosylanthranilate isomerase [Marivirga harenae]|uniref:phosphoribosylanthranilate isomerase n=1 Tax=Marivirga harenae TaxID=2010992 RepID=UPI0026DF1D7E|nr:phosphoribosylanthranilate isomerase [Marivirga harenae]WKV12314.1 phosphoribosylanthranilate isomerase [Marivirga harenae]|tara:strand:+ start:42266 stop:42892 length:627 start_codon:yes stop_codon:yes gene_type:complete
MKEQDLKIKICGMRDLNNIRQLIEFGPDYLGFIFYEKSARYVSENEMKEIIKLNFGETERVGVFVNASAEKILDYADKGFFDIVQLHGNEEPKVVKALKEEGLEVIKVFSVDDDFDFKVLNKYSDADYYLFDTKGKLPGGNGVQFNWELLENSKIKKPFFLSGGLAIEDKHRINDFKSKKLYALDFNSKLELEPGLKDLDKVQLVINN